MAEHVKHLQGSAVANTELDRLLGIVVDVENLFMCVHKEDDADTKQVYFYLFKLLRKCILQMSKPCIDGPLVSANISCSLISCSKFGGTFVKEGTICSSY